MSGQVSSSYGSLSCRELERINVTFQWIKQHYSSCLLFKAGVACCLPTCAQGSSVPVMRLCFLLGALCIWRVLVFLVSLLCTRLGSHRCASCWTRPLGEGRWGYYLSNLWGECLAAQKTACCCFGIRDIVMIWEPKKASLCGTAQSPWLLCMYGLLDSWGTSEKLQAKTW